MAAETSTLITVPPCGSGSGIIRLVEEVICALILDGVHFDFDYTFVRPEAKAIIHEIADHINGDPDRLVAVIGHTDRVGSNRYNIGLSDSRAQSVFAYIRQQPDEWMDLLRSQLDMNGGARTARSGSGQNRDRWQTRELQYMLGYLRNATTGQHYYAGSANNQFTPAVQTALDAFRADSGILAGGGPGPRVAGVDEVTWRALFERYIMVDAVPVDPGRFLSPDATLGCGERFPRLETRPPGGESQDLRDAKARLEINRRVEFLLIPPALMPSALDCDVIYNNPNSPVIVCPNDPQLINITLHFTDGASNRPRTGLTVRVTGQGGFEREFTTDAQGKVILPDGDTRQGDYRVSVIGTFGLVLRDTSLGHVRGSEVLLRLERSVVVEIMVTAVPARLNFVEDAAPFDQLLDTLPDPIISATPVQFRLAADIENVSDDEVIVDLASFLVRGPASGVLPGSGAGSGSGVVNPPTPLEFVDAAGVPLPNITLNRRFKLHLDSAEIVGDEVNVLLESRLVRLGS